MVTFASPPRPPLLVTLSPDPPWAPNRSKVAEVMPAGTVQVATPTTLKGSVCCVAVAVTVTVLVAGGVAVLVLVAVAVGVLVLVEVAVVVLVIVLVGVAVGVL